MEMPFGWYDFHLDRWLDWIGNAMLNIYTIWEAFWTELRLLPNVGIHEWPAWLQDVWSAFFDDTGYLEWLGNVKLIEFLIGSYLTVFFVLLVGKGIVSLVKK